MKETIRVLLVDDHTVVREGLRILLELDGSFTIVGEGTNGVQAVEMAQALSPDVVVMDLAMPKLNGLEAARRINQLAPSRPKILILSAHGDDAYLQQVASLRVSGYLVKQTSAHLLAKAIRAVHNGKLVYSPSVGDRLEEFMPDVSSDDIVSLQPSQRKRNTTELTSREREVLQLIAESHVNKEVASELNISIKTVEKHRQNIMEKLKVHDAAGLTRYAIATGTIESIVQPTIL